MLFSEIFLWQMIMKDKIKSHIRRLFIRVTKSEIPTANKVHLFRAIA